jgi:hypothetical protein
VIVESAEVNKCLHDELVECKSVLLGLETTAAKAEHLHMEAHLAMEVDYMSQVSSLESEL